MGFDLSTPYLNYVGGGRAMVEKFSVLYSYRRMFVAGVLVSLLLHMAALGFYSSLA